VKTRDRGTIQERETAVGSPEAKTGSLDIFNREEFLLYQIGSFGVSAMRVKVGYQT
jgi:hypothetical protein